MRNALLFDLDGTLVGSDDLHVQVFADMLAAYGHRVDEAFYRAHIHGRTNDDIFGDLCPGEDARALGDQKEAEFRHRLGSGAPQVDGTKALLDFADARRWGKAVVTNAPRENVDAMLLALGVFDRFDAIVLGEECSHGKPHPEPYLQGLRLLEAEAGHSLAFEDSPSGIRSAVAANIPTIGVTSMLSAADLRALGVLDTIESFADPALEKHLTYLEGLAA